MGKSKVKVIGIWEKLIRLGKQRFFDWEAMKNKLEFTKAFWKLYLTHLDVILIISLGVRQSKRKLCIL